jgi:hypothetical protein
MTFIQFFFSSVKIYYIRIINIYIDIIRTTNLCHELWLYFENNNSKVVYLLSL